MKWLSKECQCPLKKKPVSRLVCLFNTSEHKTTMENITMEENMMV